MGNKQYAVPLEFVPGSGGGGGGGTVTSVGTSGIATGGPITTSGTVTVAGSGNTTTAATAAANLHGAPAGDVVTTDGSGNVKDSGILLSSLGSGTVTNFTAGNLSPIFTTSVATSTTTPALTFSLTNAGGGTVFGNNTASSGAPSYTIAPVLGIPGSSAGTIALASSTASGKFTLTAPASAATPTLTLPTTSNVLAGQLAGDGTIFSSSLVTASAAGTITLPTPQNESANLVFAGPTSGGAAAPTFRAVVAADIPSGTVIWNAIGNATGNLSLSNGTNTTTFNQTSAVNWLWANTTTATSGTTNASPTRQCAANYWTGAASAQDIWTIGSSLAAGTNGSSSLVISHAGSSGTAYVQVPAIYANPGSAASPAFSSTSEFGNGTGFYFVNTATVNADGGTGSISFNWDFGGQISTLKGGMYAWRSSSTDITSAADTGLSRISAGVVGFGNGSQGDISGSIQASSIALNGAVASPTAGVYYSGTTAGVTQAAEAVGTLATTGGIVTTFTSVSDERLKVSQPYSGGLDEILQIHPIKYRWNEKGQELSGQGGDKGYVGFSAQDVQNIIPEAVWQSQRHEFLCFEDRPVIAALCNAAKELSAKNDDLEKRLARLEKLLDKEGC